MTYEHIWNDSNNVICKYKCQFFLGYAYKDSKQSNKKSFTFRFFNSIIYNIISYYMYVMNSCH